MSDSWKPVIAGILNILCGIGAVIIFLALLLFTALMPLDPAAGGEAIINLALMIAPGISVATYVAYYIAYYFIGCSPDYFYPIVAAPFAILGVLAVTGGIFGIQRKHWKLLLAGSISALLCNFVPGTVSVILTAISKAEFKS